MLAMKIVAEEAIDVEAAGLGIKLDPRPILHGVGRDRKIRLDGQTRIVAGEQRDGHARHAAQVVGDLAERRMEAAD